MQKRIDITVPPAQTSELIGLIQSLDGMIGLRVDRGASLHPPGDTITAVLSNESLHRLLRELGTRGVGRTEETSVVTAELASVVSPTAHESPGGETSDLSWEEIEMQIGKDSNMTPNALALMGAGGVIASAGLATDTLHLVIGAMIIAPGFEPIIRIPLGLITGRGTWRRGLFDIARAYAALLAGAVAGTLLLILFGTPLAADGTYLPAGSLFEYWTIFSAPGIMVSALAGAAGAVLVSSDRSVLTAGVLVALALIPTATLVGMSLVVWDPSLLGRSALRWIVDVALVALAAFPVFAWHARRIQRRRSIL